MKQLSMTASQIAELTGGKIIGDASRVVTSVEGIRHAGPSQLTFANSRRLLAELNATEAGVVLVCKDLESADATKHTLIVVDDVDAELSKILAIYAEEPPAWPVGVHPSAVVAPGVVIGAGSYVGPNAVIEPGAQIGDRTVIGAGCYIGHDVKVGSDTILYPNVTVMYRCIIGNRDIIHPGAVIGADGFGYSATPQGPVKIPQTGIVEILDDVEIGANTTVDRARFGRTLIKNGVKIDNLVFVAHNVIVGECSILVGQSGIAGSAELGRGVILAGRAGVNGHITVGDGVQVAGTSNVAKSIGPGQLALGTPAESQREWAARWALPSRFERLSERVKNLESQIAELKKRD